MIRFALCLFIYFSFFLTNVPLSCDFRRLRNLLDYNVFPSQPMSPPELEATLVDALSQRRTATEAGDDDEEGDGDWGDDVTDGKYDVNEPAEPSPEIAHESNRRASPRDAPAPRLRRVLDEAADKHAVMTGKADARASVGTKSARLVKKPISGRGAAASASDTKRPTEELDGLLDNIAYEESIGASVSDQPLLRVQTARSGVNLSPIRIVKAPDGTMQRAAGTQSALAEERKELREQQKAALATDDLDALLSDLSRSKSGANANIMMGGTLQAMAQEIPPALFKVSKEEKAYEGGATYTSRFVPLGKSSSSAASSSSSSSAAAASAALAAGQFIPAQARASVSSADATASAAPRTGGTRTKQTARISTGGKAPRKQVDTASFDAEFTAESVVNEYAAGEAAAPAEEFSGFMYAPEKSAAVVNRAPAAAPAPAKPVPPREPVMEKKKSEAKKEERYEEEDEASDLVCMCGVH